MSTIVILPVVTLPSGTSVACGDGAIICASIED